MPNHMLAARSVRWARPLVLLVACTGPMACTADERTAQVPAAPAAQVAPVPAAPAPAPATGPAPAPTPGKIEGVYAMPEPLVSELRVVALAGQPGMYRVEVNGGGNPADGAAVGADCQALAEGPLEGNRIDALLLPFESRQGGLDATDLEDAPRLTLTLAGGEAELRGAFAHCAMATVMSGHYRRTNTPELLVDCPPQPAACWMRD